jgi:signal transduction histidine kinase
VIDLARDPVESSPEPHGRPDNLLVRAVGRVRLPLRAKLIAGFAVVAALLAVGYALGFVALGQSNARGKQLRSLQQPLAYAALLGGDARQLTTLISLRYPEATGAPAGERLARDGAALASWTQFRHDFLHPGFANPSWSRRILRFDPNFVRSLHGALTFFHADWERIIAADRGGRTPTTQDLANAAGNADNANVEAETLAARIGARENALVGTDNASFGSSRDLLIGVGAGSFGLAIALALLLSWSVVAPLRRTEARLAEIGAGDFSGRLEVANRDEIGTLAERVNRMSDELQRVYRELELVSEHKSQFLANMSHELRTPLNAIIGFSEVLHEQMFGELNERQLAYVADVLEAGKHLLSLINDVLDLAKIEAGRMELELSEVGIPEVLRSAVSMHSERAGRAGIELGLATNPEEITVTADERRVRQIVFNLVSNAVKFTPPQGRVDVSARLDDGRVEIAVADNGPGIAPEELERIFEEFEQTTAGKQAEGTGLGLPLSRKLAELHGGRLWAESEPGRGSTFRFTLPVESRA